MVTVNKWTIIRIPVAGFNNFNRKQDNIVIFVRIPEQE